MTEEFKDYIRALAIACRRETFHGEYELNFNWEEEPDSDDNDHSTTFARVKIDVQYLWATLTVYPAMFEQYDKGDFRNCASDIMHELCHLFTEPLARLMLDDVKPSSVAGLVEVIERQTQRVCNTVLSLLQGEWYTPEALGVVGPSV